MESKLILIKEYCQACKVEQDFIYALEEEEIIQVKTVSGEKFIEEEQLTDLERFVRWHYEMKINLEGIDAMRHLLKRVKTMQKEIVDLRNRLHLYE